MTSLSLALSVLFVAALPVLAVLFLTYPRAGLPAGQEGRPIHVTASGKKYLEFAMVASLPLSLKERLLLRGAFFLPLALLAAYLVDTVWVVVPALGLCLAVPEVYLAYLSARERARRESQVPRAVEALCRALKAGGNLYHSLERAADDVGAPLGHDLRRILDCFSVTGDMASALHVLKQRASSRRLCELLEMLIFDLEEGVAGTPGEIERLESFLESLRQEDAVRRELTTRTAGTRFNLRLVSLTIPGTVLLVAVTDGSLLTPLLTQPLGRMSLAVSVIGYLGTFYLARKWSRVEL